MKNLHQVFDWQYIGQIIGGDFAKFCGLLRIYELYQRGKGSLVENNHRHSHPLQFEYRSKVASLENMNCQLNIYQTELYFRYVGH